LTEVVVPKKIDRKAQREAWEARDDVGYGKHDYQKIDPDTINPEDYAQDMRGDEEHYGDVREYNSAANQKHPENNVTLDWLSRVGTVFETEAPEYLGRWMVVNMSVIRAPQIWARCQQVDEDNNPISDEVKLLNTTDLGCSVEDDSNSFKQVRTIMIKKAKVDKNTMAALTQR